MDRHSGPAEPSQAAAIGQIPRFGAWSSAKNQVPWKIEQILVFFGRKIGHSRPNGMSEKIPISRLATDLN